MIAWAVLRVFNAWYALLTYLGVACAHASIDLLNDYFDYKNSIDLVTVRTPLSGGTGVLPEGLLKPFSVYRAGMVLLGCGTIVGLILTYLRGWVVGAFLLFGILSIYFYSTKIANFGMGEILLVFKGTLIVVGTYYVQALSIDVAPILVGVIMGLLSSMALYVNEFPDYEADRTCGRRNLIVRLRPERAAKAYVIYPLLVFGLITLGVVTRTIPFLAVGVFVALPFFFRTSRWLRYGGRDGPHLLPAMTQNVIAARIVGVVITVAYVVSGFLA